MSPLDYDKLLKGRYEAERLPDKFSSESAVPDFAFNVLHPRGLLYRPVVDEDSLAKGAAKPQWPRGKTFAVCLTHDVDVVSFYSLRQWFRPKLWEVSQRNSWLSRMRGAAGIAISMLARDRGPERRDPAFCFERWLRIEKEFNANSTFFFWPGWNHISKRHPTDCIYELSDPIIFDGQRCTVGEMVSEIDHNGWEIGLHSSWYSYNDTDALSQQKNALEEALGHEIHSVRQHYLHYDIRFTPKAHAKAGFKYDSTLGFNDNVGFRFGTCHPWHLYDLEAEELLPILEIPLVIQEGALLSSSKGLRLDANTAFQYITMITEQVIKVGGVLTLLWHPNHIQEENWWNLYIRTLEYLQDKGAWFASVKEVGEHWLETSRSEIKQKDREGG